MVNLPEDLGSLARLIAGLVAADEELRAKFIGKLEVWNAGDWKELLRIAKALEAVSKAKINRQNRTRTVDELLGDWENRTGIHPYDFQDCYLAGLRFLRETGQRENKSLVIRTIVEALRPDLVLPSTSPRKTRSAALAEMTRIEKALRELVDRPHEAIRPYLEWRCEASERD